MAAHYKTAVAVVAACWLCPLPSAVGREWVDATGKYRREAEFVGMEGNIVRLRQPDGSNLRIPLESLSDADQQFVKTALREPAGQRAPVDQLQVAPPASNRGPANASASAPGVSAAWREAAKPGGGPGSAQPFPAHPENPLRNVTEAAPIEDRADQSSAKPPEPILPDGDKGIADASTIMSKLGHVF